MGRVMCCHIQIRQVCMVEVVHSVHYSSISEFHVQSDVVDVSFLSIFFNPFRTIAFGFECVVCIAIPLEMLFEYSILHCDLVIQ